MCGVSVIPSLITSPRPPYDGVYGGHSISSSYRPDARILARTYGPGTDSTSSAPIASRCKSDYYKCADYVTVCNEFKPDGVRGHEDSV